MSSRLLRALPLLVVLSLSLLLVLHQHFQTGITSQMLGQKLAQFDVPVLDNAHEHFSPALWKGKVAMLTAFASWCEPCMIEHPLLMKLAQTGKIALYGLVWRDDPKRAEAWLRNHGNPYRQVGVDEYGQTTVALALTGVPETFILDRNGVVVLHIRAAITDDILSNTILPLIDRLNAQPS